MVNVKLNPAWKKLLKDEFEKPYFLELSEKVRNEYLSEMVFPNPKNIFRAFEIINPEDVKVVILGQDPYHTPGVADGLAFSTLPNNKIPPSLLNIFKEIENEYGKPCDRNPDLTRWAEQGVLLLNASLSVRSGEANSHSGFGWHEFTDSVIKELSEKHQHIVFILWGAFAGKKEELIDSKKHLILKSPHPSPLSANRGFFGNNHFRLANEYLKEHGRDQIDWH